jgi:hypothetical protein
MRLPELTKNDSDTEGMASAGGAGEWWAKHGSISSITTAMDVGKFPPGCGMEAGVASHSFLSLFLFLLSAGTKGSRWELCHLTGSPGG